MLAATLAGFKASAAAATTIDDMWSIVEAARQRRRELEALLDYRYSRLAVVFANLILEGYLDEGELAGLAEDKLADIRHYVTAARRP